MNEAVATISDAREGRLRELVDEARRELVVADALDKLAAAIDEATVPVEHYKPIWEEVARHLEHKARDARRRARRAADHVDDVQAAIVARERIGR